jgi:hypothetical protein
MPDENTRPIPADDPEARLQSKLPPEESSQQPDPGLSLTRVGPVGLTLFALVAIAILTVVLIGLNGPNEPAGNASGTPPAAGASQAPTPTAPQNGPGGKP